MAAGRITPIFPSNGSLGEDGRRVLIGWDDFDDAPVLHESSDETSTDPAFAEMPWRFVDYITIDAHCRHTAPVTLTISMGEAGASAANIVVEIAPNQPPITIVNAMPLGGGADLRIIASVIDVVSCGLRLERSQVAA
jgi:hypothetical protein